MNPGSAMLGWSALIALAGCSGAEMAQEWQLDRLRLLAIRAEPAEPQPGETVTFTSLAYVPDGLEWTAIWFACVAGSEEGCTIDPAVFEDLGNIEEMTPEELAAALLTLQEAGFIGFEPMFAPVWTVPESALDGLTDDEALEGLSATIQVTESTSCGDSGSVAGTNAECVDTELVLKAIPVSRAVTPNHNPDVGTFTLDDLSVTAGASVGVTAGQSYSLEATLDDAALETYTYRNTDGVDEERTEEVTWRWYTDNGALVSDELGFSTTDETPRSDALTWTPESAGSAVVHAVVLDGRGGMGWWTLDCDVSGSVDDSG